MIVGTGRVAGSNSALSFVSLVSEPSAVLPRWSAEGERVDARVFHVADMAVREVDVRGTDASTRVCFI